MDILPQWIAQQKEQEQPGLPQGVKAFQIIITYLAPARTEREQATRVLEKLRDGTYMGKTAYLEQEVPAGKVVSCLEALQIDPGMVFYLSPPEESEAKGPPQGSNGIRFTEMPQVNGSGSNGAFAANGQHAVEVLPSPARMTTPGFPVPTPELAPWMSFQNRIWPGEFAATCEEIWGNPTPRLKAFQPVDNFQILLLEAVRNTLMIAESPVMLGIEMLNKDNWNILVCDLERKVPLFKSNRKMGWGPVEKLHVAWWDQTPLTATVQSQDGKFHYQTDIREFLMEAEPELILSLATNQWKACPGFNWKNFEPGHPRRIQMERHYSGSVQTFLPPPDYLCRFLEQFNPRSHQLIKSKQLLPRKPTT